MPQYAAIQNKKSKEWGTPRLSQVLPPIVVIIYHTLHFVKIFFLFFASFLLVSCNSRPTRRFRAFPVTAQKSTPVRTNNLTKEIIKKLHSPVAFRTKICYNDDNQARKEF